MRSFLVFIFVFFSVTALFAQADQKDLIKGLVLNAADDKPLSSVNIINVNEVKGTITNREGYFEINAQVDDTLYFSYLGFKSITVVVTNDWKKYGDVKIKMTEVGFALEEVVLEPLKLTGYLEIDAKNIPIYNDYRYNISGSDKGYEAGSQHPGAVSRVLSSIFSPIDFLYNIFGKRPKQMRKLQKMKESDEIQRLLEDKFDRETLAVLLEVTKDDIAEILKNCNYSKTFIKTANDLQILDAISDCYENYRAINKK